MKTPGLSRPIRKHLKKNPGVAYVTADNKRLYAYVDGDLYYLDGDFGGMNDVELNEYIQTTFA